MISLRSLMEYSSVACMRQSSHLLSIGEFGRLAAQFPLGTGDGLALAGAHADDVGLELGECGEDIEKHLFPRIARGVERPAEGQFRAVFLKQIDDGTHVRHELGRSVLFRHDQGVALARGDESLVEAGPGAGRTGEAVIGVDATLNDAQLWEDLTPSGRIPLAGGPACVSERDAVTGEVSG